MDCQHVHVIVHATVLLNFYDDFLLTKFAKQFYDATVFLVTRIAPF